VPGRFDCVRPETISDACNVLLQCTTTAQIHAGGTDLIVRARTDRFDTDLVVDISRISDLRYLKTLEDGTLRVGALATLTELVAHPLLSGPLIALREATLLIGSIQIRNRATLVGNICNASPAADTIPPLVVFDARLNVIGPEGQRTESVLDFITGPGRTTLRPGELVESVDIPPLRCEAGSSYLRITRRRSVDLATTDVAALVYADGEVRFSYGAVTPRPLLGVKAAAVLTGRQPTEQLLNEAARAAESEIDPISDVRASREYRIAMTGVLVRRTYQIATDRLSGRLPGNVSGTGERT
jgi:CO/xanthine dehydrogenase FAD-binding subunit